MFLEYISGRFSIPKGCVKLSLPTSIVYDGIVNFSIHQSLYPPVEFSVKIKGYPVSSLKLSPIFLSLSSLSLV